jgi:hypothetical protein
LKTLAVAAALLLVLARAEGADVALVNDLNGNVSYAAGSAGGTAKPFMRVREGDRFSVPASARIRLLYLDSGRQESFTGPARFVAGKGSSTLEQGAAPQVATLPAGVADNAAKTMELLANTRMSGLGGVGVRGVPPRLTPEEKKALASAHETYAQLRAASAADDITPELYLYPVLEQYGQTNEMKSLAAEMYRRQPDNPDLAAAAR